MTRSIFLSGAQRAEPAFGAQGLGCIASGHERRGSLPTIGNCSFTCEFHAGGQSCEHSWLPNEEGYATADVESDQLHVPASWPPEAARLGKAGPLEAARLESAVGLQVTCNQCLRSGYGHAICA